MVTPDGWRVTQVTITSEGRQRTRLRLRNPRGIHIGDFRTPDEVLEELRQLGVDPGTLRERTD